MDKKQAKRRGRPPVTAGLEPGEVTPNRVIRVPDREYDLWRKAAGEEGQTLSTWMRRTLSRAAKRILRS